MGEGGGGGVEQLLKKKNRRHVKISRSATPLSAVLEELSPLGFFRIYKYYYIYYSNI